ncbi:hypothetical protein GCM10011609_63540 [Lentzea pudingi]|uniref:RHS repeat-associated core domain-containing protein n=1 Tax=Lentzea pudingi TaxID=1789439 RepID=A0ABQ2IND3_9PSEU|nr:RHS repeat-associated core domain-containing protein [Lentzea pudingi]GGN14261.1 hypothetical protein GCM10011609_63540 [Lentzea pudingi]
MNAGYSPVWPSASSRSSSAQEVQELPGEHGFVGELVLGEDKKLLSRSLSLPGGVLLTVGTQSRAYDHPTVRGDLSLSTDTTRKQFRRSPRVLAIREPLAANGAVDSDNRPGQMDYGWLGQHQRPFEHAGALTIVQMGARPYSPLLGRFLCVDPVEGGSAYDYVNGDPINETDLDGKWWAPSWLRKAGNWAWQNRNRIGHWVVTGLTGVAAGVGAGRVAVARWAGEPVTRREVVGWMASKAFGGARKAVFKPADSVAAPSGRSTSDQGLEQLDQAQKPHLCRSGSSHQPQELGNEVVLICACIARVVTALRESGGCDGCCSTLQEVLHGASFRVRPRHGVRVAQQSGAVVADHLLGGARLFRGTDPAVARRDRVQRVARSVADPSRPHR